MLRAAQHLQHSHPARRRQARLQRSAASEEGSGGQGIAHAMQWQEKQLLREVYCATWGGAQASASQLSVQKAPPSLYRPPFIAPLAQHAPTSPACAPWPAQMERNEKKPLISLFPPAHLPQLAWPGPQKQQNLFKGEPPPSPSPPPTFHSMGTLNTVCPSSAAYAMPATGAKNATPTPAAVPTDA